MVSDMIYWSNEIVNVVGLSICNGLAVIAMDMYKVLSLMIAFGILVATIISASK